MNESMIERIRFWLCNNILHHKFSQNWIYNGKCHNSCKICKRTISLPINDKFGSCSNRFEWRCRFALLPVKRHIIDAEGYIAVSGRYWLQYIYEVNVGVVPEWVAYASNNDKGNK